jgi:hypothetical protein
MRKTTLHLGVTGDFGDRALIELTLAELHKHRLRIPFVCNGDSFTTWGETLANGDMVHVTITATGPITIPNALGARRQLARIVSVAGLRVCDYVIATDPDDYGQRVAVAGVGALEHDGGLWEQHHG